MTCIVYKLNFDHTSRIHINIFLCRNKAHRRGFTLIEILVSISIIGILIALILPAVQAARETARKVHCTNNLKQIGIGLHEYHGSNNLLPAGRVVSHDSRYMTPGISCSGIIDRSFLVNILPFIEQPSVYNAINHQLAMLGPENISTRSVSVGIYSCPSDTESGRPHRGSLNEASPDPVPDLASVTSTSYAGFVGTTYSNALPNPTQGCSIDPIAVIKSNGCLNDLVNISFSSISDGLSQTLIVSERSYTILVGLDNQSVSPGTKLSELTGWWFLGDQGYTLLSAAYPPNAYKALGSNLIGEKATSASSLHPGGVNGLLCDGSVRFIKETINTSPTDKYGISLGTPPGVWQKLITRAGSEIVDFASF